MMVLRVLWSALREIFDENAYARFLAAHHLENSAASYRRFLEERRQTIECRVKCC